MLPAPLPPAAAPHAAAVPPYAAATPPATAVPPVAAPIPTPTPPAVPPPGWPGGEPTPVPTHQPGPLPTGEPPPLPTEDLTSPSATVTTLRAAEPLVPGRVIPVPAPQVEAPTKRRGSRLRALVIGLVLLAIVGGAGFAIGYVLPSVLLPLPAANAPTATPALSPSPTAAVETPTPEPTATPTPTPTATPTPRPTATPLVYIVKAGDQLQRIANKYGVTLKALMDANGIKNANLIIIGQKLIIPPKATPTPEPTAS